MKKALIAPVKNLYYCEKGDILMALTHLVLSNNSYAAFFAKQEAFKILDNSAFEEQLQGIESVVKAAKLINANEIVLPDIVFDADKTMQSTQTAIDWLTKKTLLGKYRLMAVPQGSNEEKWWRCFTFFNEHPLINTIGISKLSAPKAFNTDITTARLRITKQMATQSLQKQNKEYHLLGGSFRVLEEVALHPTFIRSIDTSAPFEFGKRRILLSKANKELTVKADLNVEIRQYNKDITEKNIALLMGA